MMQQSLWLGLINNGIIPLHSVLSKIKDTSVRGVF